MLILLEIIIIRICGISKNVEEEIIYRQIQEITNKALRLIEKDDNQINEEVLQLKQEAWHDDYNISYYNNSDKQICNEDIQRLRENYA